MLVTLALLGAVTLAALAVITRPLIFASLQPELAEARGVPVRLVSTVFLVIVAIAVAESAQIVGVLLVFALMVGPPAAAQLVARRIGTGLLLAASFAVAVAWLGIAISYYTDWPATFCIATLSAALFFACYVFANRPAHHVTVLDAASDR
jgi:zinc/manganese transport system permease protein